MKWEELKVYKPLKKEDLKPAYKDFTKILAEKLLPDGFVLKGRMLIKPSGDLLHIIHLDTRGSWMGMSDYFDTEIAIASIYDTETLVLGYGLTASKKLTDLAPFIRDHGRITQEYPLLADFLYRKIKEYILPYFSRYRTSKDILANASGFKIDHLNDINQRNSNLILHCELANCVDISSSVILKTWVSKLIKIAPGYPALKPFEQLHDLVTNKNWETIREMLLSNKLLVLKKLKLKSID